MEFESRAAMLAYEKARADYYMETINAVNRGQLGRFYKLWLREIFVPTYRKIKKEYDSYRGGWWRDENGVIHTDHLFNVDSDKISSGTICITPQEGFYVLVDNNTWYKINTQGSFS